MFSLIESNQEETKHMNAEGGRNGAEEPVKGKSWATSGMSVFKKWKAKNIEHPFSHHKSPILATSKGLSMILHVSFQKKGAALKMFHAQ